MQAWVDASGRWALLCKAKPQTRPPLFQKGRQRPAGADSIRSEAACWRSICRADQPGMPSLLSRITPESLHTLSRWTTAWGSAGGRVVPTDVQVSVACRGQLLQLEWADAYRHAFPLCRPDPALTP